MNRFRSVIERLRVVSNHTVSAVPVGLLLFLTIALFVPSRIHAFYLFLILVGMPVILSLGVVPWRILIRDRGFVLLAIFAAYMALTVCWGDGNILAMRQPFWSLLMFFAIHLSFGRFSNMSRTCLLFSVIACAFSLYVLCGGGIYVNVTRLQARGIFNHPIRLGGFCYQAALFMIIVFAESPSRKKFLYPVGAVFLLYVGFLTYSRGPIVAFLGAGCCYCIYRFRHRWKWLLVGFGSAGLIGVVAFSTLWFSWEKKGLVLRPGTWCRTERSLNLPEGTSSIALTSHGHRKVSLRNVRLNGKPVLNSFDSQPNGQNKYIRFATIPLSGNSLVLAYEIKADTCKAWQAIGIEALPSGETVSWVPKNHLLAQGLSSNGRFAIWTLILQSIRKKWLFGWGIDNSRGRVQPFMESSKKVGAHNLYLGVAVRGGLVGLVLMLALIGVTIWRGRHFPCLFFPLVYILIHSCFDENKFFEDPFRLWYLLHLPMFVILAISIERKTNGTPVEPE